MASPVLGVLGPAGERGLGGGGGGGGGLGGGASMPVPLGDEPLGGPQAKPPAGNLARTSNREEGDDIMLTHAAGADFPQSSDSYARSLGERHVLNGLALHGVGSGTLPQTRIPHTTDPGRVPPPKQARQQVDRAGYGKLWAHLICELGTRNPRRSAFRMAVPSPHADGPPERWLGMR